MATRKKTVKKKTDWIIIVERALVFIASLATIFFGTYTIITDNTNKFAEELIVKVKSMDYQLAVVNDNLKQGINSVNISKGKSRNKPVHQNTDNNKYTAAIDSNYINQMKAIIRQGDSLLKEMEDIADKFNAKDHDSSLMADFYMPVVIIDTLPASIIKIRVQEKEESFLRRAWGIIKNFFKNIFTPKKQPPILKPDNKEQFIVLKQTFLASINDDLNMQIIAGNNNYKVDSFYQDVSLKEVDYLNPGFSSNDDSIITSIDSVIKPSEDINKPVEVVKYKKGFTPPSAIPIDFLTKMIIPSRWEGKVPVYRKGLLNNKKKYDIYFQFNDDGTCETNYFNYNKVISEIKDNEKRKELQKLCTYQYKVDSIREVLACITLYSQITGVRHSVFKCTAQFKNRNSENYENTLPVDVKIAKIVLTKLGTSNDDIEELESRFQRKELK